MQQEVLNASNNCKKIINFKQKANSHYGDLAFIMQIYLITLKSRPDHQL